MMNKEEYQVVEVSPDCFWLVFLSKSADITTSPRHTKQPGNKMSVLTSHQKSVVTNLGTSKNK